MERRVDMASGSAVGATRKVRATMISLSSEKGDVVASHSAGDIPMLTALDVGKIAIYNFQHGISSRRMVRFGPYVIRVERDEHLDPQVFSSSGSKEFSSSVDDNDQVVHITTQIPARAGLWVETAVVEDQPALHARSLLFPAFPFVTGKDDLAFILWFLTGREVAVGADRGQRFMLGGSAARLVSSNYFDGSTIDWSKLSLLANTGASDALYAVCLALASPDALIAISVASGALDALVSRWYKDNRASPASDEVRTRFKAALGAYEARLLELGESQELIADVVARIPNLLNDASALTKLRAFLVAHEMLDAEASEAVFKRFKLLNTYRNSVAHQARLLVNLKSTVETELQVAGVVSLLLPMICRVYIAKHLLGVVDDDYGVDRDEACVRDFFNTGHFRGQNVFNESYDDFILRVDEAWTQRGEFQA